MFDFMIKNIQRDRGNSMKCTVCGNELAKVTKFCPQCGTKVKFFCTKCNTELSEGVEYCPSCGCPVTEDKTQTEKKYI